MTNAVLKPPVSDLFPPASTLLNLAVTPNDLYRFTQDLMVLTEHPARPHGTEAVILTQRVRSAALRHGRLIFPEGPVSITAPDQTRAIEAALAAPLHTSAGALIGPEDEVGLPDDLRDGLRVRVTQGERLRAAVLDLAAANDGLGRAEQDLERQVNWAAVRVILGVGMLLVVTVLSATLEIAVVCAGMALAWVAGVFLAWRRADRQRQRARARRRAALGALELAAQTVEVGPLVGVR